jgi:gamma-glutamyltranspeptidase / glutathione hydrolase
MKHACIFGVAALMSAQALNAADLSPGKWPAAEREKLEQQENASWSPPAAASVDGSGGMISATVSPVAVYAGLQALRQGGTAADAAATTALTQITTQLGSVVSYAGVFTMVYFDAKTHKVYSMDAGYNSYLNENDPASIPVADFGMALPGLKPTVGGAKGRETLVPGFMAGVEAMHKRFGKLPFKNLFAPALWYDTHGVLISPHLAGFFAMREKLLSRTPEGQAFLTQAGGTIPKLGSLFKQPELAKTLQAISEQGSRYMYTGAWGKKFVTLVQRDGGKVTAEDLARYKPIWSEPYHEKVFNHTVYVNGAPHYGAYDLLAGLNLAEAMQLDRKGPYWSDAATLQDLQRISEVVSGAPVLNAQVVAFLKSKGVDTSPANQLTKEYALRVAPLMDELFTVPADNGPHHSNGIVVIDKEGNIAAITHTINTVVWGDTGIIVDGIPLPDSAAFQQARLATIKPGDRVPHEIIDTIVLDDANRPVLATGSIGSSLVPESLRVLLGYLGQHQDLATLMAQPPLLANLDFGNISQAPGARAVPLVQGAYSPELMAKLRDAHANVSEVPPATAAGLRGTLAAVAIDAKTGKRTAANQPGVMVFNAAQ